MWQNQPGVDSWHVYECLSVVSTYSVHVRRTDKLQKEAKFHGLEEYMFHVNQYYEYLETRQTVDRRRVYIATDDPSVLAEATTKYEFRQLVLLQSVLLLFVPQSTTSVELTGRLDKQVEPSLQSVLLLW